MNIREIIQDANYDLEAIKDELGSDSRRKIWAILDILAIGEPNIAHSKMILELCSKVIDRSSVTMGVKTDA